ncbi:MAG: cupin domain-containing protein [Deltaproteobacteria bacterium]|nr:cupin domain-containing protein [Deltaproteobacteria bacterium]
MEKTKHPVAILANDAPPRIRRLNFPEPFATRMGNRDKRALGDVFGLTNFGINITRVPPGAISALRHAHSAQDEFVYVLEGNPTLVTDAGDTTLKPGMCAGFKAGTANGHHLVNRTQSDITFLEIGDRSVGDKVSYPDDDLQLVTGADGNRQILHKDGTPY